MSDELADDEELRHRTPREVAERCLALTAVVTCSLGRPRVEVKEWLERHRLAGLLSQAERRFLNDPTPPRQLVVEFSWRAEALAALLWALGGLDELEPLNEQVDLAEIDLFQRAWEEPQEFLQAAVLRPSADLGDTETFLYEQHWRVRDAQLFHRPMPPELDAGIVYERRYAMSWLVGFGSDWDDVPTDT